MGGIFNVRTICKTQVVHKRVVGFCLLTIKTTKHLLNAFLLSSCATQNFRYYTSLIVGSFTLLKAQLLVLCTEISLKHFFSQLYEF